MINGLSATAEPGLPGGLGVPMAKRCEKYAAVMHCLVGRAGRLMRQGYVAETWREYRGRRLGPYYRLWWREEGRKRSVYLGRDAALAEEVRASLRQMQAPLRKKREADRRLKQQRAMVRQFKARWEAELHKIGLRLKGFEVRGPVRLALHAYYLRWYLGPGANRRLAQTLPAPQTAPPKDEGAAICGKTKTWYPKTRRTRRTGITARPRGLECPLRCQRPAWHTRCRCHALDLRDLSHGTAHAPAVTSMVGSARGPPKQALGVRVRVAAQQACGRNAQHGTPHC
jgi:hypothetical protein